jgi:ABC-type xylose transport system permease subunit
VWRQARSALRRQPESLQQGGHIVQISLLIGATGARGGIGRVDNVVLGALFTVLLQDGMNIAEVGSYIRRDVRR